MNATRKWYRWHASSAAASAVVLIGFVLIAAPGVSDAVAIRYGWPYVHYMSCPGVVGLYGESPGERVQDCVLRDTVNGSRQLVPAIHRSWPSNLLGETRFWSDGANWRYVRPQSEGRWLPLGLAVNLATAVLATLLAGSLFEFRRRRRRTLWELRIADLLAFTSCVCIVLAARQLGRSDQLRDESRVNAISNDFHNVVGGNVFGTGYRLCPIWLARLCDERIDHWDRQLASSHFPMVTQALGRPIPVTEMTVRGSDYGSLQFDPRDLATRFNELPALDSIRLVGCSDHQLELLQHLDSTRMRSICIYGVSGELRFHHLAYLTRFARLRRLELLEVDIEQPGFPALRLEELEELVITTDHPGEQALALIANLPRLRILYLQSQFRIQNLDEIRKRVPHVYVTVDLQQAGGYSAF